MKTYEQLKKKEKCIYQAFTKVNGVTDLPSAMGLFVNGKGIDADDERAVIALAEKYGFTRVEGVKGADVSSGFYRFDNNAEIIAVITGSGTAMGLYNDYIDIQDPKKTDPVGLLTDARCKNVYWHAVYGKTDDSYNAVWQDDQKIYRNGPLGNNVSVCFIKK